MSRPSMTIIRSDEFSLSARKRCSLFTSASSIRRRSSRARLSFKACVTASPRRAKRSLCRKSLAPRLIRPRAAPPRDPQKARAEVGGERFFALGGLFHTGGGFGFPPPPRRRGEQHTDLG